MRVYRSDAGWQERGKDIRADARLSVKWEGAFSGSVDSVLRAAVLKACGSTDPMRVGRSAGRIFAQMQ